MKLLLPTLLFSSLALIGCGGSSDTPIQSEPDGTEQVSVPFDTAFYGLWSVDELVYMAVTKESIALFSYDSESSCHEATLYSVTDSTETAATTATTVTTVNVQTGEESYPMFELNGDELVVDESGIAIAFSPATSVNMFPGCDSVYGVDNVDIELELSYLPPTITIDRDAQDSGYVEYEYAISFDLNKNDVIDVGDVTMALKHYKGRGDYASNTELSIVDLGGNIWTYLPRHQSENIVSSTNDDDSNRLQFSQNNNVLTVSFDVTQHPLLAHISEDTPIQVTTFMSYPEPESEVVDTWQDGPWAWSSDTHKDALPDEGFTKPNLHPSNTIQDATADLIEGESRWVDIKSVVFRFL